MSSAQKKRKKRGKRKTLSLIQYCMERKPKQAIEVLPSGLKLRGIYALFKENKKGFRGKEKGSSYEVVYIGISTSDIRKRLQSHKREMGEEDWTHFSFFKVWPNITDEEIEELEALFLHIYSQDTRAEKYNKQKIKADLKRIRIKNLTEQGEILRKYEKALRKFPDLKELRQIFGSELTLKRKVRVLKRI